MTAYREPSPLRRELGLVALLAIVLYPLASFAARGRGIGTFLVVVLLAVAGALFIRLLPRAVAAMASRTLLPTTPGAGQAQPPSLSRVAAHESRGEIDAAVAALEALLREGRLEVGARFEGVELLVRHGRHARAVELLHDLRALPRLSAGDRLRASNRLVDLHLGPLADRDRAVRELRRIAHDHAGSAAAAGAERLLAALLAELRAERAGAVEARGG